MEAEVVQPARDRWIERLAWLMDNSIPIGPWRIGIDGLVGLVPGFGDLAGALVSMLIVLRAVQVGVPGIAVARMTANIAIDALLGAIPLVGDLFDFAWKANLKNYRIYQETILQGRLSTARHWAFFVALGATLLAIAAVPVFLLIVLIKSIR